MSQADDVSGPKVMPVTVPHDELSADALNGVVEAFILREGTDYGLVEASFADKRAAVMRQLEDGSVVIVYDPETRSVDLVVRDQF